MREKWNTGHTDAKARTVSIEKGDQQERGKEMVENEGKWGGVKTKYNDMCI